MKGLVDYINEAVSVDDKIAKALKSKESFCLICKQTQNNEDHLNHIVKNNGYDKVVRVYLDKAEPEDLQGVPTGKGFTIPEWMKEIIENKNSQYVLVFSGTDKDFTPEMFNIMMPIILENTLDGKKYNNFIVCLTSDKPLQLPKPLSSKMGNNIINV